MNLQVRIGMAIAVAAVTANASAQTGRPSVTALEVAAYRAIGAKHPDPAIRNEDRVAERLLGPEERAILTEVGADAVLAALTMDTDQAWASLGNRSVFARGVHVRTRHIDAVLSESLRTGSTQVVILGAGLDSRAYRFGDLLGDARVFELDLPQTQEYKKKRVREVFGALPGHVTYVPIDFAKQELGAVLAAAGYDRKKKTIFIWEGVTMYIPEAGVDATLRAVARNAVPGSLIVFDYFLQSALQSRTSVLREVAKNVAAVGEPFVFGMPGENASAFVTERGLKLVSDFGSGDLGARYLPKGNNLPTPSANHVCTAVVP
jgi:methyltransferase (TIGR00027 family)